MGGGSGGGRGVSIPPGSIKPNVSFVKYRAYSDDRDETHVDAKKTATRHLRDLQNPPDGLHDNHRQAPTIIQFLNIHDNTHQVVSKVDVGTPLFQPFPPRLGFHKYEQHKSYEQILWFRNNDYVPRRIKIETPTSGDFSVRRMRGKKGGTLREVTSPTTDGNDGMAIQSLKNGRPTADNALGKVAPGMEVAFKVRFTPKDREDYNIDLVCVTEREKFLVPVVCVGDKPALDFPDSVTFDPTPAKCRSAVTRVIRNAGSKTAHFRLWVPEPFAVFPSEGVLGVGETMQVRIEFYPERVGTYECVMEVDAGQGVEPVTVQLVGAGCEMRVGLDCGEVEMLPTFVGKTTRRTFRVVNRGDRVARFEIKKLGDAFLDEEARLRATREFAETDGGDGDERNGSAGDGRFGGASSRVGAVLDPLDTQDATSSSSYDSDDEDAILGADAVRFAARQKGLQKSLANDPLLFTHKHFTVFPQTGEVQPGCEFEVTVKFSPDDAGEVFTELFVEVEGRETRLPLFLKGQAVGPLVVFNYDALEVGNVFVGAAHQYEVELVNRGEIACSFQRIEHDADGNSDDDDDGNSVGRNSSGRVFSFQPSQGVLSVGQSRTITVTLCSEKLGPFDETFEFFVQGGERSAFLDMRGTVVGPSFELDVETINFGISALGLRNVAKFTVTNTCEIPMRFAFQVPGGGGAPGGGGGGGGGTEASHSEFAAFPSSGTILPFGQRQIELEWIPRFEKKYDQFLVLDVPGVGNGLACVKISAQSLVADLRVNETTLAFGTVFARHEVTRSFTIQNPDAVPGKFQIQAQDSLSSNLAVWVAEPSCGTVQPGQVVTVTLALLAMHQGMIRVPLQMQSVGSKKPPKHVSIEAFARGPLVTFFNSRLEMETETGTSHSSSSREKTPSSDPLFPENDPISGYQLVTSKSQIFSDTAQKGLRIRFGKRGVLRDFYESVFVKNDGPVAAEIRCFTKSGDRAFEVVGDSREFLLAPGASSVVTVRCHMDQTTRHADTLCVMVTESGVVTIPIDAEGTGSLLTCDELFTAPGGNGENPTQHPGHVDFGNQLVARPFSREFVVTNNSRIPQQLVWQNVSAEEKRRVAVLEKKKYLAMISPSGARNNFLTDKTDGDMGIVFFVEPERVSVLPKTSTLFTLFGVSEMEGSIVETLVLRNLSGAPHEQGEVLTIHATARCASPLLQFSQQEMGFEYSHDLDGVDVTLVRDVDNAFGDESFGDDRRRALSSSSRVQQRALRFKNVSNTTVTFVVKTVVPFAVDKTEWVLEHNEEGEVQISFDPEYRGDRVSHEIRSVLQILYIDVPQVDEVHLGAEVRFPNLSVNATTVNFGAVLNDTTERKTITISNRGDVPARYEWVFDVLDNESLNDSVDESAMDLSAEPSSLSVTSVVSKRDARRTRYQRRMGSGNKSNTPLKRLVNPETVFDVRPIRGVLQPGESEVVEVSYFARADSEISAIAVCEVHGGPSYDVCLTAEAHEIRFEIDTTLLLIGKTQFDRSIDRLITIRNLGRVDFAWKSNSDRVARTGLVVCEPAGGTVVSGASFPVTLRIRPGAPGEFSEVVDFEVAHFTPVPVTCVGEGVYQAVGLSLPRVVDEKTAEFLNSAKQTLEKNGPDPDFPEQFRQCGVEQPWSGRHDSPDRDDQLDAGHVTTLDSVQLEQFRLDAKAKTKAIAAPAPRVSEVRATTRPPDLHKKTTRPGFNSVCSTGRGVADFMKQRVAQRERLRLAKQARKDGKDDKSEALDAGDDDIDDLEARSDAPSQSPREEPSRTFDDVLLSDHVTGKVFPELQFTYEPSTHEIEHEADKLRMREVLLQRERDRASVKAARIENGKDADTSGRDTSPGYPRDVSPGYPKPPGSAPGGARPRTTASRVVKPSLVRTQSFTPGGSARVGPFAPSRVDGNQPAPRHTNAFPAPPQRAMSVGSPLGVGSLYLPPGVRHDDSYLLGPSHRHNALGLPPKLPATQASYLVDFGHVAMGGVYRKRFRVQNLGTEMAVACFDKSVLQKHGFDVFPEVLPKLSGAPFFAYVDCDLVLDTARVAVVGGLLEVDVALTVKGAPQVVVRLTAVVDVPVVQVSTESLAFADTKIGHRHTKHFQLFNDGQVPSEWSIVKPASGGQKIARQKGDPIPTDDPTPFKFVPTRGVLRPGQRINVKAHFTPRVGSSEGLNGSPVGWNKQHAVRVEHNPGLQFVNLTGAGVAAGLRLERENENDGPLDLGVVVPFEAADDEGKEGTEANEGTDATPDPSLPKKPPTFTEREIWLVNDLPIAVEVFAVDFDAQFVRDETALAHADGLFGKPPGSAKLFLPPRQAGEPLWKEIQDKEDLRLALEAKKIAAEEAEAAYQLLVAEATEKGEAPPPRPEPEPETEATEEVVGEGDDDLGAVPPDSDGSSNLLVLGAPFSGSKEICDLIVEKYGVFRLNVDEIVTSVSANVGTLGDFVRQELGLPPLEESLTANPDPDADGDVDAGSLVPAADETAEETAPLSLDAEDDFPEELANDARSENKLSLKTLVEILKPQFADGGDFENGFVLDGLIWDTCDASTLLKALRRSLNLRKVEASVNTEKLEGADDEWTPPALEDGAFSLHSAKRLTVLSLAIDDAAAGVVEKREKEEAAAKELGAGAVAAEIVGGDLVGAQEDTQEEDGTPEEASDDSAPYAYEKAQDAAAHRALVEAELPLLGSAVASNTHVVMVTVDTGTCDDAQSILDSAVTLGAPEPPHPPNWIPPDALCEIAVVAPARPVWDPVAVFQILTPVVQPPRPHGENRPGDGEPGNLALNQDDDDSNKDSNPEGAEADATDADATDAPADAEASPESNEMRSQTRWTIPANGAVQVIVRFTSDKVGDFHNTLSFECVNGVQVTTLTVVGRCEYPRIVTDPKVVFGGASNVKKTRPKETEVGKIFIKQTGTFEFGPLVNNLEPPSVGDGGGGGDGYGNADATGDAPVGDVADGAGIPSQTPPKPKPETQTRNAATFTMKNPSAFVARVSFQAKPLLDTETGEPIADTQDTFAVSPAEMLLRPGESKELTVTAYPKGNEAVGETEGEATEATDSQNNASPELVRAKTLGVKSALVECVVEGNPTPHTFTVTCVPVTPKVTVDFYPERTAVRKRAAEEKAKRALAAALRNAEQKKRDRILGVETKKASLTSKPVPVRSFTRKPKGEGESGEGEKGSEVDPAEQGDPAEHETKAEEEASADDSEASKEKSSEEDTETETSAPPGVFFGKRLCSSELAARRFIVANDSLVPVRWRLVTPNTFPAELIKLENVLTGKLAPGETHAVQVKFGSPEPNTVDTTMTLHVFDENGTFTEAPTQSTTIVVQGETWKIDVDVSFPDAPEVKADAAPAEGEETATATETKPEKHAVDFGLVKSTEQVSRRILLTNNGKYASKFRFDLRNACGDVFVVEPGEGVVEPGSELTCVMTFDVSKCVDLTSPREVKLVDVNDVSVTITELDPAPNQSNAVLQSAKARTAKDREVVVLMEEAEAKEALKNRATKKLTIWTSIHASFASYRITPRRGIDFGPALADAPPETVSKKFFDVTNDGAFPFQVFLFDRGGRETGETEKNEDGTQKAPPPNAESASVRLGAFVVTPGFGTVLPGEKTTFEVSFAPTGDDKAVSERLGLDVTNRDPADQPLGILYALAGESCVPGINCADKVSVFEEHLICESELESFELSARPGTSVYSKRDDAFSFGAVLANLFGLPGGKDSGEGTETSEPTAETDGNDGGTSAPQAASTVTPKNGTSARFKISNNKKVKCVVDVSLTPIDREQGGGGATAEHPPMSLAETSKLLEIPPHEHRFVTVFFAPAAIAKFAATLRAVVRDGSDDKTRELRCELRGEGALPHVTVETPAFVDEATSSPTVTFPMTPLGSVSQKRQITLRNDGVLPAFCRLDYALKTAESHNKRSPITVIGAGVTTEIAPGTAKVLDVTYEPREEGDDSLQVVLAVKSNAFETRTIHIQGSGYVPDVLFENLNHSFPGSLKFNDGPVGSRMVETFTLSNASRKNWRFEFPDFGDSQKNENETSKAFQFTPRVGHLPAGTSTTITATFLSRSETLLGVDSENPPLEVPVKLVPVKSYFEGAHLEYLEKSTENSEGTAADAEPTQKAPPPKRRATAPKWTDESFEEKFVVVEAESTEPEDPSGPPKQEEPHFSNHKNVLKAPRRVKKRFAIPEPAHLVDETCEKSESLFVHAVACDASYEIDASAVVFKPTLMFQARTHRVTLINTGKARLPFTCETFRFDKKQSAFQGGVAGEPPCSYEISPSSGVVLPGQIQEVIIRFAPTEVVECKYTLQVRFPGAYAASDDADAKVEIDLDGVVLRPWCHFEVPESSYLTHRRRPSATGAFVTNVVNASTKVLEFVSLGLGIRQAKRFEVLNPTNRAYEFFWEKSNPESKNATESAIRCVTTKGVVAPGKRYEMAFEYTPKSGECVEQVFTFNAPSVGVVVPFLCAGTVTEPRVALSAASLHFGKCLVDVARRETISVTNHELVPFEFRFVSSGFGADGGLDAGDAAKKAGDKKNAPPPLLRFEPTTGTVPPLSAAAVTVTYQPKHEGSFNANVSCVVSRKPNALRLNVKAESFLIRESVQLEPAEVMYGARLGQLSGATPFAVVLAPAPARNALTLGRVTVDDVCSRKITAKNDGEFPIDLRWDLGVLHKRLGVDKPFFSVKPGEQVVTELTYAPDKIGTLSDYRVSLQVTNGRRYDFVVAAESKNPAIAFSTREINFGHALVVPNGTTGLRSETPEKTASQKHVITLKNNDDVPFTVDCLFASSSEVFSVGAVVDLLAPGQSADVVVAFRPNFPQKFNAVVSFLLNGVCTTNVKLSGEGVFPKVDLVDSKHGTRDFGQVGLRQTVTKEIVLRNSGKLTADVCVVKETLASLRDVDVHVSVLVEGQGGRFKRLSVVDDEGDDEGDDDDDDDDAKPKKEPKRAGPLVVSVPRNKTVAFKLQFTPTKRSKTFQVPFHVSLGNGQTTTVSLVMGACIGVDVSFSKPTLDFGAVTTDARLTKTTLVQNLGDVGSTFTFDVSKLKLMKDLFDVFPTNGYVAAGATQEIRVTFRPKFSVGSEKNDGDSSYDFAVPCVVDGGEFPMELGVSGRCVAETAPSDTIEFATVVRGAVVVETTVTNPTNEAWRLRPSIANENWSGVSYLEVPANGTSAYQIKYAPLAMSSDDDPHIGTLRLELPDGSVDARSLRGVADAPDVSGTVEVTVPAKQPSVVTIEVKNWLPKRQRFTVTVAFSNENHVTELVALKGADHLDVPAGATRAYALKFYGYLAGVTTSGKVTFTNHDTGEYCMYDVNVTTIDPETQGVFTLRAACRTLSAVSIPVSNPLSVPVTVTVTTTNSRTFPMKESYVLPPKGTTSVEVGYRPVVPCEANTTDDDNQVLVSCDELGAWPFTLELSATASGPERGVSFTVPLGSSETKPVVFTHFLTTTAPYSVLWKQGGGKAFSVATTHAAQAANDPNVGVEESVSVTFEPTAVGQNFRDLILIESDSGGSYVVPVSGRCVPPKPVGPILLQNGSGSLDFKNVFETETQFTLTTDNPAFTVANRIETIGAKQSKTIAVKYTAPGENSSNARTGGVTAKLLVTTDKAPGAPWAFYLKASH